jgi:hypothetical protein
MNDQKARQAAYDRNDKKEVARLNAKIFQEGKAKKVRTLAEILATMDSKKS